MLPFSEEYFLKFIQTRDILIKVKPTGFFYKPIYEDEPAKIGFRCDAHVKAGDLKGKMNMKCEIDLPKDFECKISKNDPFLNEFLEDIEFIKTGEELGVKF